MKQDSTQRFSDRVDNYVKYRPGYPTAVLTTLQKECNLQPHHAIADIGAGTGILSQLFLENGNIVYGVEPNEEMRQAAATLLANYAQFTSMTGTAEATNLPDNSVEFVTAGQAFHWFDAARAKVEFQRILGPHGWAVLVWNLQNTEESEFMRGYQAIVAEYSGDYNEVRHTGGEEEMRRFFNGRVHHQTFDNAQQFDWDGFLGRALSSSYVPLPDTPHYEPMVAKLRELFERFKGNGRVTFSYVTHLYWGNWGQGQP
jgi:ubiquinone/menaquinone biosynthesis C-methylase UbiE